MMMLGTMLGRRGTARAFAVLCAAALALSLCFPTPALAYFSKPAVGVYFGSSSLSLTTGSSGTVSVSVDMWSEQQLPGCGMAECPQACGNLTTPDGVLGGCLSGDGWCQCSGTSYITAYTQLSVASSNPSVARASISGGALSITAYAAGSATITVYSSLSKHAEGASSMTVYVSDPAPAPTPDPAPAPGGSTGSGGSGSGGGSGSDGGSASGGGSGDAGASASGGTVSVTAAGTSATAAAAAAAAAEGDDAEDKKVVELEGEDGAKVIVAEATDAASAAEALKKVAGTEGTVTFWSGGTLDAPSISWTFKGADLAEDADLDIDPTVTVSKKGAGDVARLLSEVKNAIVMDFSHSGALPAAAEVYVRASGVYDDGAKVGLYTYDEQAKKFKLVERDVEVQDGYAVFSMNHCSVWALSDEDLEACEASVEKTSTGGSVDGQTDATQVNVHAQDGLPYLVGIGALAAVAAAAVAVAVVRRKRRAADADGAANAAEGADGDEGENEDADAGEHEDADEGAERAGDAPAEAAEPAVPASEDEGDDAARA